MSNPAEPDLDPNHVGYYVLLSHIYAVEKKWDNVAKLRPQINEKGLKKKIRNAVNSFIANDSFYPASEQIYGFLRNLELGFDIDLSLVNSLLNLYAKTGPVKIAAKLYRRMPEKDVIS
ncbi:putative pentatricopeptide repeat-containing protein [Quercus suber]|uniref:Pentatricopeptide repeat-containing protein n=1 Tax=Quercus suber TaxID=58331 RepID=A0AAW0JF16_QUESU